MFGLNLPKIRGIEVMDWVVYIIIACFCIFIWKLEHKDIHCPSLSATKEECDNAGGMAYSYTKANDTDTCGMLLDKITKAAGAEQASVKWRKAFLFSTAIMATTWLLVGTMHQGTALPKWRTLLLSIMIGYCIILGTYLYYSYHVFGVAEKWIKENVQKLRDKGCVRD